MPKMTHWNSPEPIEVSPEKAAVYRAQGWVNAGRGVAAAPTVTAMTTASAAPAVEAAPEPVAEPAPKKAPAKKAAKKTAKKS